jgi:hypothetical protein
MGVRAMDAQGLAAPTTSYTSIIIVRAVAVLLSATEELTRSQ